MDLADEPLIPGMMDKRRSDRYGGRHSMGEAHMTLRLTTGFCSGMSLKKANEGTRPTSGKVRAAVLNALQMRLAGARMLDAFAGSGAVGIEALSRGAAQVTFVESDPEALAALSMNLKEVDRRAKQLGLMPVIRLERLTVAKALGLQNSRSFDLLWFDPPYASLPHEWRLWSHELDRIATAEALMLVESDEAGAAYLKNWSETSAWELQKQRSYGIIHVSSFRKKDG
jgi:16S rRNA (guanine(966)-N(2))-methyltransferase RsmD